MAENMIRLQEELNNIPLADEDAQGKFFGFEIHVKTVFTEELLLFILICCLNFI